MKIKPNGPCVCGSGLKFKKCCGSDNPPPFAKDYFELNRLIAYEGKIGEKRRKFCEEMVKFLEKYYREVKAYAEKSAQDAGKNITCAAGCSFCCTQFVNITLQEAETIVFYLYTRGKANLDLFIEKYRQWRKTTKQSVIFDHLLKLAPDAHMDIYNQTVALEYIKVSEQYSRLNIPCPFLNENYCMIYPVRPRTCASYMASSPPHHCDVTNDLVHDASVYSLGIEKMKPYFLSPDEWIYSNAPLLVYEMLQNGYVYLDTIPPFQGIVEKVLADPAVIRIIRRNQHLRREDIQGMQG